MSKYHLLGKFLREQPVSEVAMSFAEIERVTGVKLPPKAQFQRAWWSNNPSNNVMTKVWLDAGFRSEQVDLQGKKLVFKRVASVSALAGFTAGTAETNAGGMAEPKKGFVHQPPLEAPKRHPIIGALKGWVVIEPGYDLTEPAMPEWAELIENKYGPEKPK